MKQQTISTSKSTANKPIPTPQIVFNINQLNKLTQQQNSFLVVARVLEVINTVMNSKKGVDNLLITFILKHEEGGTYQRLHGLRKVFLEEAKCSEKAYRQAFDRLVKGGVLKKMGSLSGGRFPAYEIHKEMVKMSRFGGEFEVVLKM